MVTLTSKSARMTVKQRGFDSNYFLLNAKI
jgi:hypothetical protein